MALTLIIGNKRYSSWSLRAWLILKLNDLPFTEERVALFQQGYKERLVQLSAGAQVPVLVDADNEQQLCIFDSLSIAEYLAESFNLRCGWPADKKQRAYARSLCALMHAGFTALRQQCPMDVGRIPQPVDFSEQTLEEVQRINQILSRCLLHSGGPFLFGTPGIVDAYYAPVIIRLDRYALLHQVSPELRAYSAHILALPAMQDWVEAGQQETERIVRTSH